MQQSQSGLKAVCTHHQKREGTDRGLCQMTKCVTGSPNATQTVLKALQQVVSSLSSHHTGESFGQLSLSAGMRPAALASTNC